ncbi:isochorismatase domain-containing protein [Coprinopsis cinerea okayama7|uniref:Isochorismatase domain-containing protein n=1 Tax=Coprinopsis cinerea (strain Okayama-7 / 130 / ATCC MYA-4618 / FGSC 9003) TaxID=240176 RepID=A8NXZ8_COPC7|nr:isochorismatase domain-containing protein [Coprinopsis cinerea okayama7\|eukprot:XP_001837316.2 isochorismatase domain-containing protein [Coprinopsis cinerea okayama7\
MPVNLLDPATTIFFLCDIQTKFRSAIYGYDQVVATANKLIKVAKVLNIEVLALGEIDPAINTESLGPLYIGPYDKTLFSMFTADVKAALAARPHVTSIVLFGIETALDLIASEKYTVHIVADGVSSCNAFEIPIALDRMRTEGAIIGTSESIAFQLMKDAAYPNFKAFSKIIKEEIASTKAVGQVLPVGYMPNNLPAVPRSAL